MRKGETVIDLGSGGGIDIFLAAIKVGSSGSAIGLDMSAVSIFDAHLVEYTDVGRT